MNTRTSITRFEGTVLSAMLMALLLVATPLRAGEADDQEPGKLEQARIEGQLWATYALNRHLNPFDIDVEVEQRTAILEGEVDQEVKKELAEQIALSVDGIEDVDNRLDVNDEWRDSAVADAESGDRSFGTRVQDATLTATVKSKLLWNRSTAGLSINVSTENGVVELVGEAESDASRELAERLAANTEGVTDVINQIEVVEKRQAGIQ